jgi:hypothetical protein
MSPPTPRVTQTLVQRAIRETFATREYAIFFLVACCVVVEIAILVVTQQYEAVTAPAGSVMLLGMSSAGLVVFVAELLKLPIAWASGVVTGWTRIFCNVVAAGLCLLTATTIKDLTTREWDLALAPSRAVAAEARELRAEISSLEQKQAQLAQNTKENDAIWAARLAETDKQIELLQRLKLDEEHRHIDQLKRLSEESLAGGKGDKIRSLEQLRDRDLAGITKSIEELTTEMSSLQQALGDSGKTASEEFSLQLAAIQAERARIQRENSDADERATRQHEAELAAFSRAEEQYAIAQRAHEADRMKVSTSLEQELEKLRQQDRAFFNLAEREAAAREAAQKELDRLEAEWKSHPRPQRPTKSPVPLTPLPDLPTKPSDSGVATLRQRFDDVQKRKSSLEEERSKLDASRTAEIAALYEETTRLLDDEMPALRQRRRLLEQQHGEVLQRFDAQVSELMERRMNERKQRAELARSPAEIERELQEIPGMISDRRSRAEQKESEAKRLQTDTNAIRAASGVIRWFMPGSDSSRQEEVAYGIYPVGIGLLVAFLPAALTEFGVHSLTTPPAARRRSSWNVWKRIWIGRRALRMERASALRRSQAAEQTRAEYEQKRVWLEEEIVRRQQLLTELESVQAEEHRNRMTAIDREVESRAVAIHQELADSVETLKAKALQDLDVIMRQREDITRLATEVRHYGG